MLQIYVFYFINPLPELAFIHIFAILIVNHNYLTEL